MFVPPEEALAYLNRESKAARDRCLRHEHGSAAADFYGKEYAFFESLACIAEQFADETRAS